MRGWTAPHIKLSRASRSQLEGMESRSFLLSIFLNFCLLTLTSPFPVCFLTCTHSSLAGEAGQRVNNNRYFASKSAHRVVFCCLTGQAASVYVLWRHSTFIFFSYKDSALSFRYTRNPTHTISYCFFLSAFVCISATFLMEPVLHKAVESKCTLLLLSFMVFRHSFCCVLLVQQEISNLHIPVSRFSIITQSALSFGVLVWAAFLQVFLFELRTQVR